MRPDTTPDTTPEGALGAHSLKHITVKLTGENGNIYNLMGVCARTVRRQGNEADREQWKAVQKHLMENAKSYDEALVILMTNLDIE